jgi:hypothetical protein
MPTRVGRSCKVTATFEVVKSNIYDACVEFNEHTPLNQIVDFYRRDCGHMPVHYPDIANYVANIKNDLVKDIFTSIKLCGLFGHNEDENGPWDFNISARTIRAAQRSAQISVSPDMNSFSITIDHVPETLKYAYQYFDEHMNSTYDEFMAACQGYPTDNYDVNKTEEFGEPEFVDFCWTYIGGGFYDISPLNYSFFY